MRSTKMNTATEKGIAIITGATHGIGKGIAERCLAGGLHLAICARNEGELLALKGEWLNHYPDRTILTIVADVSDKNAVAAFASIIEQTKLPVDLLVNNAGLFRPGNILDEPEGQLEEMMAINLYSAYNLTRALLPVFLAQQQGHIFNICSVASLKAYPAGGSYGITKHALLGFSDNLREELTQEGIKVTAVAPGATWSKSWEGSGVPEDRVMQVKDVAEMIWAAFSLGENAVVERIIIRPQLGDL